MIVSAGRTLSITKFDGGNFADAVPMMVGGTYYAVNQLQLSNEWAAYGVMYRTQPWVYSLVRKVSVSGARLPLLIHERADDGSRPPVVGSAYGDLLARPSSQLDAHLFWLWVMSTFELYGEAILWKWRDEQGQVRELFPLHPSNVTIRRLGDGTLEYLYTPNTSVGGSPLPPILASDIVHFKGFNPSSPTRGLSWLEPLRQTLLTDDASRRAQAAQWRNGARPSVVIEAPNQLSDAALKRVAAGWSALHSGVDNWSKTVILEEGMKVSPFQMSAVDMQYIAARQLAREECCAVADVPPPVVHILDRATFSNITEQMRSMYRDTMSPRLALYESVLDHQLRPDFDPGNTIRAAFDMNEVLSGSPEMQAQAFAQMISSGQMTPNEARAAQHHSPHPDGDRLLVNAAFIPLGATAGEAPTGTAIEEHPQAVKAVDVHRLLGKISRETGFVEKNAALDGVDPGLVAALDHLPPILRVGEFRAAIKALELETS
jgi:HK97 family phage portal protein